MDQCPGDSQHGHQRCDGRHQVERRVYRDDKGSARFHGQAAQHLEVARKCVVDQVRLLGIDKAAFDGDGTSLPDALRRLLLEQDADFSPPQPRSPALPDGRYQVIDAGPSANPDEFESERSNHHER